MKIIDHSAILSLGISPLDAYHWVENVIQEKETAILPPKISMRQAGNVFYNVMPCILQSEDRMGVKIITRHPEKTQGPSLTSQILLYELSSGQLIAVLDGSYITAMRTGAVAAYSAQLFGVQNFTTVGIMGLGITATATMDILSVVNQERSMEIHLLRYKGQERQFMKRYESTEKLRFVLHDSTESLIRSSQVILSCVTCAEKNFAEANMYQPGCTVIPVHTMGFQNCDLEFDKIFTDDIGHIKDFQYFDQFKSLAEVSEVIHGNVPGRTSKQERILVYNIGIAIHDVYFANQIWKQKPNAMEVSLEGPLQKMWFPRPGTNPSDESICKLL